MMLAGLTRVISFDERSKIRVTFFPSNPLRTLRFTLYALFASLQGAKEVLKRVIGKYPQSNRAGCALMYLAQRAKGEEQENYLKEAIQNHSDCFYGDGVQVGAYARFYLADYYLKLGKTDEAKALQEQIRKDYPDAVDHSGKPLMQQSK